MKTIMSKKINFKHLAFFLLVLLVLNLTDAKAQKEKICNLKISKQNSNMDTMMGNGNNNNRSLSSWSWISHISSHRVPRVIFEARCHMKYCSYPNQANSTNLNSVPIYHEMLVLLPDPLNRTCYTTSYQKVAVGCTCVRAQSTS